MRKNILIMNLKGGASKTTNSSLVASYLNNSTLVEIDKINESDANINNRDYYDSIQIDFINDTSDDFLKFEDLLLDEGLKIIDVGAVKLEIFHKAMVASSNYDLIDLLIIPSMDGVDDFNVALNFLETIKELIPTEKIIFSFNRFNSKEYSVEQQFDNFFDNEDLILEDFDILLEDNYYVLQDSMAIKKSRKIGETLKYFADKDINEITRKQRDITYSKEEGTVFQRERVVVRKSQEFEQLCIVPMIQLITQKLEVEIEEEN